MRRQYRIAVRGEHIAIAHMFASQVEEAVDRWALFLGEPDNRHFVGYVWKDRGVLVLCPCEDAEAQAEANYPISRFWSEHGIRYWPVRAGVVEAAGSVGR